MRPAPSRLSLAAAVDHLPMKSPFRISGYTFTEAEVVVATLSAGEAEGRGEADGVYYLGDDAATILAMIESVREAIEAGADRAELARLLPAGGARNALDSVLWDLEARQTGRPVWQIAGLAPPKALLTTFTLGADDPAQMARGALGFDQARALKLKLTGEAEADIERVRAVRAARPDVWIGVDGNQGFTLDTLDRILPTLVEARVSLLEQPLARGREADLQDFDSPIPLAADESVQCLADIEGLVGRFDVVNIKLDKCGGLTEGLLMVAEARRLGLKVMVGCMSGSSLAMAPAFLVGQLCDLVDLDAPTFLAQDRQPGVVYADGHVWCGEAVWGAPAVVAA
ncbi:L-alanine-DL-glutamate epimerase-like enolase superfamily enzyme [Caulobacter ginsengisoli]|uniref:Dipeptide epimerase n=1 Tax=Caulobacter ginsengisoli TaxID=400775 RepID=A0ABU0IKY5_9CAUL|nr:dipeptide epimerase [Caulobacter ginsengisoli]MDQ0462667.1 L-alanine-DL-glutamate epimerase-like enolase superfamily enzyme [Caulobacter ginsengisoli]